MDLGRVTYNNLVDEGTYQPGKAIPKPKKKEDENNYLALATALMTKMSGLKDSSNKGGAKGKSPISYGGLITQITNLPRWLVISGR